MSFNDNFETNISHNNDSPNFAQNIDTNNANIECIDSQNGLKVDNNYKDMNNKRIESINETQCLIKEDLSHSFNTNNNNMDSIESHINSKANDCSLKRKYNSMTDHFTNDYKRFKLSPNNNEIRVQLKANSLNCQLFSSELKSDSIGKSLSTICDGIEEEIEDNNKDNNNSNVEKQSNYSDFCDYSFHNNSKSKKSQKHVKWRESIVNEDFNEDSLSNMLLSETYYYYGLGIVTGEQGSTFGGNRFDGFSRHLFSDETGITVELCKPFIINRIFIDLENKTDKKSPFFSYKVFIAIDECMTDWDLIKECNEMVCFGQQNIHFYPRIVQYIRIIGNHGIYCEKNRNSDARYFTVLNFDCTFDETCI